ncbi:glycosyltransferase [Altererythrobacter sp. ZODW24]|uniref:glycosyltransferase n=1 Tax=Altererythrobacter sp. ZODW24 TaxID=2185142 RepID=UPI0013B3CE97|nr:glycosyltransferase [Altererythrobacter sp. ZODW24]
MLTASASRLGGGVFEAVVAQAAIIKESGGLPMIFALEDEFSAEDAGRFGSIPVSHSPVSGPRQIGFAPGLLTRLVEAELDCLHLHGIWQYPSRAGYLWSRRTGGAYLISPHGMLDPWITARGKWKKALARTGYERASWRAATALHALTSREAHDIADESGRTDSTIIPNAGPVPAPPASSMRAPEFLYLGRIHPKKNIAALVDGWLAAAEVVNTAGARLTIAGWGDAADVEALRSQLASMPDTVRFVGPAFGAEKDQLFGKARFLVLPSMSEGLPVVVLEAWAKGTPTLMSQACNLPSGYDAEAAIDCGMTAASVESALRSALTMDEREWVRMSDAANGLASGEFSSVSIARRWITFYQDSIAQARGAESAS